MMGLSVVWKLDLSLLLDGEGYKVDNGFCCPKEEHSCMKVVRPI